VYGKGQPIDKAKPSIYIKYKKSSILCSTILTKYMAYSNGNGKPKLVS